MRNKQTCGKCAWFRKGYCRLPGGDREDAYVGKNGYACEKYKEAK